MHFNDHWRLDGRHADMSPSVYHWIDYDVEKFKTVYTNKLNARLGDRKHALAAECIRLGIRQVRNKQTFNSYVNDAIGYRMTPEQMLVYSENCFGTADAIGFDAKKMVLRISDLKTGYTIASIKQLRVYAAIFCLEYRKNPYDLLIELRIYQNDEVFLEVAEGAEIKRIMDVIVKLDKELDKIKELLP